MSKGILDGLTIQYGYSDVTGGGRIPMGGGIWARDNAAGETDIIIRNCVVKLSEASYYGGGIYAEYDVTIDNCTVEDNDSGYNGGGIYLAYNGIIQNSIVSSNDAKNGGSGGGIYIQNNGQVLNTSVTLNTASGDGGGIYVASSGAVIDNCTISSNTATAGSYGGGGLCFYYSGGSTIPILSNSTVSGNVQSDAASTKGGGGAVIADAASISNTSFINNSAASNGGGVLIIGAWSYASTIDRCVFNGNAANGSSGGGGGVFMNGSTTHNTVVSNSLFHHNTTTQFGSAARIQSGSGGKLVNSTVTGNNATGGYAVIAYSSTTVANCIVYGNTNNDLLAMGTSANNLITDPLFSDAGNDDYRVTTGSGAIDAGSNSYATGSFDLDNVTRIINGTADVGAYEYNAYFWDGSESTDWATTNNWSFNSGTPSAVPDGTIDAVITATSNNPVITSSTGASCRGLTINSGATFTVNAGGSLITNGAISNAGTINIKQSIPANGQWHFIAMPNASTLAGDLFSGMYLQQWVESGNSWLDIIPTTTPLNPVQGYSLWVPSGSGTQDFTYTGTPNTGNQSIAITNAATGTNKWMNLVGNPYPSYLDWDLISGYGTKYTWNGTAYTTYTESGTGSGSQYAAPMEAFFIYKDAGVADNFSLTNAMRTHQPAGDKSGEKGLQNGLVLYASNGSYNDDLWVVFDEGATEKFQLE